MVLGLLAIAAIPATIGTTEAINQRRRRDRESKRDARFALDVYCESPSRKRDQVHGKTVVFRDNKMYIRSESDTAAYPFAGFYIHYPNDDKPLGLVSMVSDDPPMMNWIYVDKATFEVKYGNRTTSLPHIVGEWDWTDDELGLTLEGHERFVAIEEARNVWAVHFDRTGDLRGLPKDKRILDISLERRLLPQQT